MNFVLNTYISGQIWEAEKENQKKEFESKLGIRSKRSSFIWPPVRKLKKISLPTTEICKGVKEDRRDGNGGYKLGNAARK